MEQNDQPVPREQAHPRQVSGGGLGSRAKEGSALAAASAVATAVVVAVTAVAVTAEETEETEETPPPVPPPAPPLPPLTGFVARKTTLWPLVVYCRCCFCFFVFGVLDFFLREGKQRKKRVTFFLLFSLFF